ncbi:hypothetical protein E2542_SST00251 [Spatholobus suberectus]|nr:hypothetical protein E2542_SST00251 [Spatholobus suberectus]
MGEQLRRKCGMEEMPKGGWRLDRNDSNHLCNRVNGNGCFDLVEEGLEGRMVAVIGGGGVVRGGSGRGDRERDLNVACFFCLVGFGLVEEEGLEGRIWLWWWWCHHRHWQLRFQLGGGRRLGREGMVVVVVMSSAMATLVSSDGRRGDTERSLNVVGFFLYCRFQLGGGRGLGREDGCSGGGVVGGGGFGVWRRWKGVTKKGDT